MAILAVPCTIIKVTGHDLFGQEKLGRRRNEMCGVVKLYVEATRTTVRVDGGATRGAAYENTGLAKLLLSPNTIAEIGDILLTDAKTRYRIAKKFPRYTVMGKLDHYEVDCGVD